VDGAAARVEGCRASGKEQIRGVKRHQSVAERREFSICMYIKLHRFGDEQREGARGNEAIQKLCD
jgi:hypothetical protein